MYYGLSTIETPCLKCHGTEADKHHINAETVWLTVLKFARFKEIVFPAMFFFWGGAQQPPPRLGQGLLSHEISRSHTTTHHSR
jgi:hypothetical protein